MSVIEDILGWLGLTRPAPIRASQTTPYVGMDQGVYFGLDQLNYFQAHTNMAWVGGYLDSPAPFPGEITPVPPPGPHVGHNRNGSPVGVDGGDAGGAMPAGRPADLLGRAGSCERRRPVGSAGHCGDQQRPGRDHEIRRGQSRSALRGLYRLRDRRRSDAAAVSYLKLWFELIAEAGIRPGLYAHGPAITACAPSGPTSLAG